MKPNITFYVIILPALLLFTSIYAQTWSWEWSVLDIQISPGEERLRNSCLAFHLLDEPSPRFVYESGDRLLMVHDINPDPENHYWAVDSSFFDIFSTFHQQNFSPRWYATGEDSTVRLSCLTFVSADSAYHFSSYTRNAYLPHSQWNEDIGMRYSFVEEDTMRYYRGYGGWIPVHADIDNDGDLDWIVCSGNNANIIRFINEIDYWRPMLLISTKPIVPYSSTQWDVNHFTTVDLDNDHLPELVVTYSLSGWELIRTNQYALYCSDLYQEEMQISRLKGPVENVGWISQLDLDNDGNFEIFATDDNSMVQWEAVLDGSVYKLDKKILWSSPENVEAVWCDNTSRKVRAIITADVYEEIDRASHEGEHDFHYFFDYWQYDQISDDWNWRGRINEEAIEDDDHNHSHLDRHHIKPMMNLYNSRSYDVLVINEERIGENDDNWCYTTNKIHFFVIDGASGLAWKDSNFSRNFYGIWNYHSIDFGELTGDQTADKVEIFQNSLTASQLTVEGWNLINEWDFGAEGAGVESAGGVLYIVDMDGDRVNDLLTTNGEVWKNLVKPPQFPVWQRVYPFGEIDSVMVFEDGFAVIDWEADGDADFLFSDGRILVNNSAPPGSPPVSSIPIEYRLVSVWPNPFNASLRIRVEANNAGLIGIQMFDLLGREITKPILVRTDSFTNDFWINTENIASGSYLVSIQAGDWNGTKRVVLLR